MNKLPDDLFKDLEPNLAFDLFEIFKYLHGCLKTGITSVPIGMLEDLIQKIDDRFKEINAGKISSKDEIIIRTCIHVFAKFYIENKNVVEGRLTPAFIDHWLDNLIESIGSTHIKDVEEKG